MLATPRLAKRAYLVALEKISHELQIAGNDGPLALKQHVLFRQGDFGEEHGRRRRAYAEVVLVLRQRCPNARVARCNPPEAQARLQGAPAENGTLIISIGAIRLFAKSFGWRTRPNALDMTPKLTAFS